MDRASSTHCDSHSEELFLILIYFNKIWDSIWITHIKSTIQTKYHHGWVLKYLK